MIDISYKKDPILYEDYRECIKFLSSIKNSNYFYPEEIVYFHHYSEVRNDLQFLAIEAFFATQNQEHTKLILWSDWDISDHPWLKQFRDKIEFRVFDPIKLSIGTPLEGKTEVLLADDSKHYMKSGLLRFLALYIYGGIWFDIDMILLRDLKPILDQEFAYVWAREFRDFTKFGPCAAFMGIQKQSEHASICLEELIKAPIKPNTVARDCDMLAEVYKRKPFSVFPSAFFNTEWQMEDETRLRKGWFKKTEESNDLFLDAFAWHWHSSGGDRIPEILEVGSKFYLIREFIKNKMGQQ